MRLGFALLLCALLAMPACAWAQRELRVDFYDVGKADAMLITTPQGKRILIDAATNKEGKKLAERLEKADIARIDLMIITHYDKDHVGGADQILEKLRVDRVIMPVYDKESKQYSQFMEALDKHPPEAVERMAARAQMEVEIEPGISLRITAAQKEDYGGDEENDFSLAVRMTHGEMVFLFAGDAEDARQREMMAEGMLPCDVLKVPHHGRMHAISAAFVEQAGAQIAFVPDDKDEPADERLLALLDAAGSEIYCAKNGGVTVFSDGARVWAQEM